VARVLLTGATGFVGGRVAQRLRDRGDDVVALVRTPNEALGRTGVEQVVGALDGGELPSEAQGADIDAVVHAAASMDDDLEAARKVNRDGTRILAEVARRRGAPFVYVSTTSVYDLPTIGDTVVQEDAPLLSAGAEAPAISSSASAYGITKAEGEAEVDRAAAAGLAATVLRPPAVLGTGPTSTWGTRIPSRLRDGAWTPPHPVTTMGWVHIDDLVDAILAAVHRPTGTPVNVIGGHATFGLFVTELARLVPGIPAAAADASDTSRVWRGSYATGRLGELLGLTPQRSFDEAMAEIGRWWSGPEGSAGVAPRATN
jgi:2-alkyl-3-oxoalkanoate reductase